MLDHFSIKCDKLDWFGTILEMLRMEKLTFQLRIQQDKFYQIWNKWILFITPIFAFPLANFHFTDLISVWLPSGSYLLCSLFLWTFRFTQFKLYPKFSYQVVSKASNLSPLFLHQTCWFCWNTQCCKCEPKVFHVIINSTLWQALTALVIKCSKMREKTDGHLAVSYKTTLLKKQIMTSTVKWYVPIFNTLNNFKLFSGLDK